MATAGTDSWSFSAIAINADATNRLEKLKDLSSGLEEIVNAVQKRANNELSILTVSELTGKNAADKFLESLGWEGHYYSEENILTAWDPAVWEAVKDESHTSKQGRYQFTKLKMKTTGKILLYGSVHLPHKKGKQQSYSLLEKAIQDLSKDVDGVAIGGDWNTKPSLIKSNVPSIQKLAFKDGDQSTTKAQDPIDNFGLLVPLEKQKNWRAGFLSSHVEKEMQADYATHAPIWVKTEFRQASASATVRLLYYTELIRLVLAAATGTVTEDKSLVHSGSTVRYYAKRAGLMGSNDREYNLIERVLEQAEDVLKKLEDMESHHVSMQGLVEFLKENDSNYEFFAGKAISVADLASVALLCVLDDQGRENIPKELQQHQEVLKANPKVAEKIKKNQAAPDVRPEE